MSQDVSHVHMYDVRSFARVATGLMPMDWLEAAWHERLFLDAIKCVDEARAGVLASLDGCEDCAAPLLIQGDVC